tara:strand:+ start:1893 stop:2219 length:327 start_codon:yes stop_codon:yes gene_type:complete
MASSKSKSSTPKRVTPTYTRAFRYRTNGNETNRKVLVTAQNQNSLRGFDISDMTARQITSLQKSWTKVQSKNIPLAQKESMVIKGNKTASTSFRKFSQSKVRYFLKNA